MSACQAQRMAAMEGANPTPSQMQLAQFQNSNPFARLFGPNGPPNMHGKDAHHMGQGQDGGQDGQGQDGRTKLCFLVLTFSKFQLVRKN